MTTISAGVRKSFVARQDGEAFTVIAGGGSTGSVTDANGSTEAISQTGMRRVFGPLSSGQRIVVYMQVGACSVFSNMEDDAEKIQTNSSCTLIGDSGLAFGNSGTSGMTSNSHVMWANDYLFSRGQGIDVVSFRAVGGKTVAQVISEQLPGTLADQTEIAWLHVGGNSLNTSIGNISLETYFLQMEQLISALSDAKKLVLVEAICPVNSSAPAGAKNRAATYQVANAGVQAICRSYANVLFLDSYQVLIDSASATLEAKSGYMLADGLHFATLGQQQKGYFDALKIIEAAQITPYRAIGPNLLPALSGTGGTTTPNSGSITGTPPVGWNVLIPSGSAAVTITQEQPDRIRLTCTNAGGTVSTIRLRVADTSSLGAAIGAATGHLQGRAGIQVSGVTNATLGGFISMTQNPAGNNFAWATGTSDPTNEPTPALPTKVFGGMRTTPPMPVAATTTQFEFVVGLQLGASTGAAVLDVYAPELRKLTEQ